MVKACLCRPFGLWGSAKIRMLHDMLIVQLVVAIALMCWDAGGPGAGRSRATAMQRRGQRPAVRIAPTVPGLRPGRMWTYAYVAMWLKIAKNEKIFLW